MPTMTITVRPAGPADEAAIARVLCEAFNDLDRRHAVPQYLPTLDAAEPIARELLSQSKIEGLVALEEGAVVGIGFLHDLATGYGVSPLAVAPAAQGRGVGRLLLDGLMERAGDSSVRLLQDAFNNATLALYARYGFVVREQVTCVQGVAPQAAANDGLTLRPAPELSAACAELHARIMHFDRPAAPIEPLAALRNGELTGYAVPEASYPHSVAHEEEELLALIGALAGRLGEPLTLAVPASQSIVLRRLLDGGMRVHRLMNLMVRGAYEQPDGARILSGSF
jgi:ribosomal protein S18 acetylase RimI-like enzyme